MMDVENFLNAINAELEFESAVPHEFDDELHDGGEWVFEYRDGMLNQIGYFPLRAVNDPIPVWKYQNGKRAIVALPVKEWHNSIIDFANFYTDCLK